MDANHNTDPVLPEVERFLQLCGMTATAFGQRSLNDPTLVHELRRGRECKMATRRRIRDFIRDVSDSLGSVSSQTQRSEDAA